MKQITLRTSVSMKELTTFQIGGRPALYARPRGYDALASVLGRWRRRGLPFRVLGGGSNVLAEGGDLPFGVVHICAPGFNWIRRTGPATVRAGAGVPLGRLLRYCREAGLAGLEFLAGIPGTLGGALAGNTGAWGHSIGECLVGAWTLDEQCARQERHAGSVAFGYRQSSLGDCVITEAELALEPRRPALIEETMTRNLEQKARRHPTASPNAGCVFKNPAGASAGKLLDLCGMKGKRIGGAEVSSLHANFICNAADASARNVEELIELMREAVRREFGVRLELELKLWGVQRRVA